MRRFQRHKGNFAEAMQGLARAKPRQRLAIPAEAMDERINQGVHSDIFRNGAWYNANFNEVNKRILATRQTYNPLIAYPTEATDVHRTGEFYLTDEVLIGNEPATVVLERIAEQDAKKPISRRRVLDLGQTTTHDVPTDCFADDETIVFLAQGKTRADNYGLCLKKNVDVDSVKVYMQPIVGEDKSRGFWLDGLDFDGRSDFLCGNWDLYYGGGSVFGVYESAEGTSQKNSMRNQIARPSLSQVLRYARPFVPQARREEFEKGLKEKYHKA